MKRLIKKSISTIIVIIGCCVFAPTAFAQVETCEVAALLGEVPRDLCGEAGDSRQPVLCYLELKKVNKASERLIKNVCIGTRNANLSLKCQKKFTDGGVAPQTTCASFFRNKRFEPAAYENTNPAISTPTNTSLRAVPNVNHLLNRNQILKTKKQ